MSLVILGLIFSSQDSSLVAFATFAIGRSIVSMNTLYYWISEKFLQSERSGSYVKPDEIRVAHVKIVWLNWSSLDPSVKPLNSRRCSSNMACACSKPYDWYGICATPLLRRIGKYGSLFKHGRVGPPSSPFQTVCGGGRSQQRYIYQSSILSLHIWILFVNNQSSIHSTLCIVYRWLVLHM